MVTSVTDWDNQIDRIPCDEQAVTTTHGSIALSAAHRVLHGIVESQRSGRSLRVFHEIMPGLMDTPLIVRHTNAFHLWAEETSPKRSSDPVPATPSCEKSQ